MELAGIAPAAHDEAEAESAGIGRDERFREKHEARAGVGGAGGPRGDALERSLEIEEHGSGLDDGDTDLRGVRHAAEDRRRPGVREAPGAEGCRDRFSLRCSSSGREGRRQVELHHSVPAREIEMPSTQALARLTVEAVSVAETMNFRVTVRLA